jgi:predicted peptidase
MRAKKITHARVTVLLLLLVLLISFSCKSQASPEHKIQENLKQYAVIGGYHQPHFLGTNASPYGYYLFTPESYQSSNDKFPILVFLHGYGERGNSQNNPMELDKILRNGPTKLIKQGTWNPSHGMIVAAPQCHGDWWERTSIKSFIEFLMETYRVDHSRIYLTGLSMGGYATFDLLSAFGEDSHVAAAVPVCGSGILSDSGTQNLAKIPLWVFHGDADNTVSPEFSKAIVPAVNGLNPEVRAKLTIYPGVGHDSWGMTYDGSGMGTEDSVYDAFNQDIYDWMYIYHK